MTRVLVAFDKFKGSLDAERACDVAVGVLRRQRPEWVCDSAPLSDGGEGFCRILTQARGGRFERVTASGPLFDEQGAPLRRVPAALGIVDAARVPASALELLALRDAPARLALLDMASVNGLAGVAPAERDVWRSSSYGTGELLRAAAARGADALVLGVGGSATSDLGLGAACALGLHFEDAAGRSLHPPVPALWSRLARVRGQAAALPPLFIAGDVDNPLLGPNGAAAVYGPQKGLAAADVARLDAAAARVVELLRAAIGFDAQLAERPGAGAAGGIAFGLMAVAGARLIPGFELVARWCELAARIAAADVVITGEGRFDLGSWSGKGPGALVSRAHALGRECVVFAGSVAPEAVRGSARFIGVSPPGEPLARALVEAPSHLERAIEHWLAAGV